MPDHGNFPCSQIDQEARTANHSNAIISFLVMTHFNFEKVLSGYVSYMSLPKSGHAHGRWIMGLAGDVPQNQRPLKRSTVVFNTLSQDSRLSGSQAVPSKKHRWPCTRQKCPLTHELHDFVTHDYRCLNAVPMTNATQNLETLI